MPRYLPVLCAIVLAVAHFFYYHGAILDSPWRFNDDVVQHYLWLYDTNWGDDFYARTSGQIQPYGFRALLRLLSGFADPLTISRYGPLLVTALTFGFATRLLQKFFPPAIALAGAYLIAQDSLPVMVGFLARSFCVPLILAFANYLLRRRFTGLAVTLVAGALFYPPALLLNGFLLLPFLVAWLGRRPWRGTPGGWARPYAALFGSCVLAGVLTLLHARGIAASPDLGDTFSRAELGTLAEFSGAGRVAFRNILNTPTNWIMHYFMQTYVGKWPAPDFGYFLLAVAIVLGALTYRRTAPLGGYLLAFLVTTTALYQLAKLLTPKLFLAARYIEYPWLAGVPLLFVFVGGCLWALFPRWWSGVAIALLLAYVGFLRQPRSRVPHVDVSGHAAYYTALGQLPDTALIAAPPHWASYVPLLSRRAVLLGHEQAHALYFRHYHDYVSARYADYQTAMATDSLPVVADFMENYGVDYLVVDRNRLLRSGHHYFEPYKQRYAKLVAGRAPEDFALLRIPAETGLPLPEGMRLLSRPQIDSLVRALRDD